VAGVSYTLYRVPNFYGSSGFLTLAAATSAFTVENIMLLSVLTTTIAVMMTFTVKILRITPEREEMEVEENRR